MTPTETIGKSESLMATLKELKKQILNAYNLPKEYMGTVTGRLSHSKPNLESTPKVPQMILNDYAQAEARIAHAMAEMKEKNIDLCGACIAWKFTKFQPLEEHTCALCGNKWPGNRRREAVLHTRRKKKL